MWACHEERSCFSRVGSAAASLLGSTPSGEAPALTSASTPKGLGSLSVESIFAEHGTSGRLKVSQPTGAACQPDCARRPDHCRVRCGSICQLGTTFQFAPPSRPLQRVLAPLRAVSSTRRWRVRRPFQRKIRGEARRGLSGSRRCRFWLLTTGQN
jgi:hypothetical protein